MNKKVSILIITIILTMIVFSISTYLQKKLVNYIPTMKCLVATDTIEAYEKLTTDDVTYVDMPIEIIANVQVVQDITEIEDLYLKDKIYKGQIILLNQFDSKDHLMIYNADAGKEKISIKIKSSENGVSFTLRENSIVNVYATLRNEYVSETLWGNEIKTIGNDNDGYSIFKILDSSKVLGTFDSNGENIEDTSEKNIDTILLAVTPEEAQKINLIREIAIFNVTELGENAITTANDNSI